MFDGASICDCDKKVSDVVNMSTHFCLPWYDEFWFLVLKLAFFIASKHVYLAVLLRIGRDYHEFFIFSHA